ncbi:MAG: hypothetical protein JW818_19785 [Pirellulales bacterium]|nr:hypothetical protein [Pirellulales bacterium]
MDKQEARVALKDELARWSQRAYDDLVSRIGNGPATGEIEGPSGTTYQFEIDVLRDGPPGGNVRIVGSIDDGGIRAFFPLTDSFALTPDGTLVDEDPR